MLWTVFEESTKRQSMNSSREKGIIGEMPFDLDFEDEITYASVQSDKAQQLSRLECIQLNCLEGPNTT